MEKICTYCVQRCLQKFHPSSTVRQIRLHIKSYSTNSTDPNKKGTMRAWQIHQYGGNEELTLSDSVTIPKIKDPRGILINIHAASINPIDCHMRAGYGSTAMNAIRQKTIFPTNGGEFPLILGRDFSGEVVETGRDVRKFQRGDEVWGTVFASKQGCLADYTIAQEHEISLKPSIITHTSASSIPYVACTVSAAFTEFGGLRENSLKDKRVLIYGGSGGIGTFAIQLMKAFGAEVATICSTDAVELVTSLGADVVIDYTKQDVRQELANMEKFDIILDSFGKEKTGYSMEFLKSSKCNDSKYITLKHPFLKNIDDYGIPVGLLRSLSDAAIDISLGLRKGISHRWAIYLPKGKALERYAKLVDDDQIIPVIDKVFQFEDVPSAFEKVEQGHARGKTVIQMVKEK